MDFAERAGAYDLDDAAVGGTIVVDVIAHLRDAPILARGVDHGPAFADGVGERLLDEDVPACLAGGDDGHGVPVIGRGDHDCVEIFAFEEFAEVMVSLGLVALCLFDGCGGAREVGFVQVADGGRDDVGVPHKLVEAPGALTADSDEAELDLVAGGGQRG